MVLVTLLKSMFFALICAVLLFMLLAIPLGLEMFFTERLSERYTFESIYSIKFLDFYIEVNMGLTFAIFLALYTLCFIASFRSESALYKGIKWPFTKEKGVLHLIRNPLLALPILSSLTYVISKSIHLIQEMHNIPLGEAPISKDPLIAFLEISVSPLIEEIVFRILPIGTFLITYILSTVRVKELGTRWETLKFLISILLYPKRGREIADLRAVKDHGFLFHIEQREWLIIVLTSAIFSFSHYSSTWEVGKLSSSFVQGLIMGLSYVIYGIPAPIIVHWFLNYHLYTYNLVRMVNPKIAILTNLNEYLTVTLGIASLIVIFLLKIKDIAGTNIPNIQTLVMKQISRLKSSPKIIAERYSSRVLEKISRISLKSFTDINFIILFLISIVFAIRLLIIGFPSPESGEKYYESGFVFDEVYYVKAARLLLRGESTNNEHPPLVKIFIMAGILLFGDNPIGWRLFPILFSSLSIIFLYMLTVKVTRNKLIAFSTAILFMFDIMAFNIGQIAILDIPSITFIFVACIMLVGGRYDLSGIFFGLAMLCKLSALFSLGIVFSLLLRMISESDGSKLKSLVLKWLLLSARIFLLSFTIFLLGIWVYDAVYRIFNNSPINHIIYMLNYHSILRYQDLEEIIHPLEWINPLNPFPPIPYYVSHSIAYYGIYSPLWWSIWVIVPLSLKEAIKDRSTPSFFILTWIMANFTPHVILAYVLKRYVYPFYFCMTLPGLYLGLSYSLAPPKKSLRVLLALIISIQVIWFIIWFPVKPKILVDLLSSLNLQV